MKDLALRRRRYVSKSIVRASRCETHFAGYYLKDAVSVVSPPAVTGVTYHKYKADYIKHLVKEDRASDPAWVTETWLKQNTTDPDALALIQRDAVNFSIFPDATYGVEIYIGVDSEGTLLEKREGQPGHGPMVEGVEIGGTLDWIQFIEANTATATDWKTTYDAKINEEESAIYALLLFAAFPYITRVIFQWAFVRSGINKSVEYERADLKDWIRPMVWAAQARVEDLRSRFLAGERLSVNPNAGLCMFCELECPVYAGFLDPRMAVPPLQNAATAQSLAQQFYVAKLFCTRAEKALKNYVGQMGSIEVADGFAAVLETSKRRRYPFDKALGVLGVRVEGGMPAGSPEWDVPLASLYLSGLTGFAKAKCRDGMQERLDAIAKMDSRSRLKLVRIVGPAETANLLPEGDIDGSNEEEG